MNLFMDVYMNAGAKTAHRNNLSNQSVESIMFGILVRTVIGEMREERFIK